MSSTRTRMLDAAIEIIARDGLRALTFRAIEEAASASHGSTIYYFKHQDGLIAAVLQHLAERDQAALAQSPILELLREAATEQEVGRLLAGLVEEFVGRSRALSLARYEIFLYTARRPEQAEAAVAHWRGNFIQLLEPMMAQMGAVDPVGAARFFMSAFDGVLLGLLISPSGMESGDLATFLTRLLRAVTGDTSATH
ncbi:TetR/AcrR family transcriptional regulator [Micromonospora sp. NPDC048898]|uniref:TetR/AcrR family transcriptional regulator n=1 Tax=Micromonospora sp. NPDC048898 TaxID=3364260 RepID=UPI0037235687